VGQQLGRAWTIAIGFLDWLKGIIPITLASVWGFDDSALVLAGLATVIGHDWSIYLNFKGGRGMATTVGLLFALDARLALTLLFFIAIGWMVKRSAIGAFVGLLLLAPAAWLFRDAPAFVVGSALLALIIAIKRLEANRLPLPPEPQEKRAVLWRRLWMDRDVPPGQAWQERGKIQ
jgi:glycerol-3-phosphate acyltransferase PlsY